MIFQKSYQLTIKDSFAWQFPGDLTVAVEVDPLVPWGRVTLTTDNLTWLDWPPCQNQSISNLIYCNKTNTNPKKYSSLAPRSPFIKLNIPRWNEKPTIQNKVFKHHFSIQTKPICFGLSYHLIQISSNLYFTGVWLVIGTARCQFSIKHTWVNSAQVNLFSKSYAG